MHLTRVSPGPKTRPPVIGTVISIAALVAVAIIQSPVTHAASNRANMVTPVAWLAQHLHDPDLVILQVGDAYPEEHVPGAQLAKMDDFTTPHIMDGKTLMTELPADDRLLGNMQRFGITPQSRIVLVESDDYFSPTTRIYLTLVYAGLGDRTTLLEGGLTAWKRAGQPVTADVPTVKPSTISSIKKETVTVDSAYVQSHGKTPGIALLDVRSPAAWAGVEPVGDRNAPRFGHIPGAVSLPLENLWDVGGFLKPEAELEKIFADAGVKPGDTVVGYCYVGQRATATLFAAKTLGHPVLLYDGSMEEWSKLGLPLEMPKKDAGK